MKLHTIVVCVCSAVLMQMCSSIEPISFYNEAIEVHLNHINGVSEQFKADVMAISEKNKENIYVMLLLEEFMRILSRRMLGAEITVNRVKDYLEETEEVEYKIIDNANIMQSLFSKQFPPERIGGLVNLMSAIRPSASEDEIQKALDYLYGRVTDVLPNAPKMDLVTCAANNETEVTAGQTTSVVEKFKLIVDLDSRVNEDVTAIAEKFPCHDFVYEILLMLINELTDELNGTTGKINACAIKANAKQKRDKVTNVLIEINSFEEVLATRLPTGRFNDLLNALKALNRWRPFGYNDAVKKALEYFYGSQNIDGLVTKC